VYRVVIYNEALEQIAALPAEALAFYAEVPAQRRGGHGPARRWQQAWEGVYWSATSRPVCAGPVISACRRRYVQPLTILLDWTRRCDGLLNACPAARRREQHGSAHPQHVEHVDTALALQDQVGDQALVG
jgi:hypothetical protein